MTKGRIELRAELRGDKKKKKRGLSLGEDCHLLLPDYFHFTSLIFNFCFPIFSKHLSVVGLGIYRNSAKVVPCQIV